MAVADPLFTTASHQFSKPIYLKIVVANLKLFEYLFRTHTKLKFKIVFILQFA